MNYKISHKNTHTKYIQVEACFSNVSKKLLNVNLPAWRPGRYEIQNFAKNIGNMTCEAANGEHLSIKKTKKDVWQVKAKGHSEIIIKYDFYADIQNAGGSYVESKFLYLNPINFCLYLEDQQNEACQLEIDFAANTDVATGMSFQKEGSITILKANNFHDLVDSPIMLSSAIQHKTYTCQGHLFHIWVKGKIEIPWDKVLTDFEKFTSEQIGVFGEFPVGEYHFMLWMMSKPYYHGVEHHNSTMMTLGPDAQNFDEIYIDILGLASHELFHTWNVKKIRPKELLPYDYSQENYFGTCFVAEGLTTFYGDWLLYRSGVIDKKQYQNELETTLKRHFEVADNATQSLLESSFDLWLDGYEKGIPDRKVSVYNKGAIAGLILHHLIQLNSNKEKGLDDLMKELWLAHGKPLKGYSYRDYQNICKKLIGTNTSKYFREIITGNQSIKKQTNEALRSLNFTLIEDQNGTISVDDL
ncbi:M61 family metallopeptidase [Arcticibacterium luteifluviistationis]|uniref:Peptidase M61 n=1 Tax=Arcticibacterium luteifluviistationis TaxID=1784714 RepID=A0A2Z4GDL9_9BACT|nr:M61 family metallopeptidase [Arcticibacterium luteifluviistationis]AWV99115.1 peptidase M61 [Arcticibacterium luteifluviistationis]